MTSKAWEAVLEIGFAVIITLLAVAVILVSLNLPVSLREPLGSSTIPQIVSGLVIFFCFVLFVRSFRVLVSEQRARSTSSGSSGGAQQGADTAAGSKSSALSRKDAAPAPRQLTAVFIFLLAVVYVAIIESREIPAFVLTPAFLFVSIMILRKFQRVAAIPALAIAMVIGVGLPFLFTEFFNVNLP